MHQTCQNYMKNKKIYQICEISKFGLHLASLPQKKTFSVPIYNHKDEHLAKKKKYITIGCTCTILFLSQILECGTC